MELMTLVYVDERMFSNAMRDFGDWEYVNGDYKTWLWKEELVDLLRVICKEHPYPGVNFDSKGAYICRNSQ